MARTFVKLTRSTMRALKAGQALSEHGITFRRSADNDGIFSVNVMVDGRRFHRVIGRESDGTTRTHAEIFIAQLRTDARNARLNLPRARKTVMRLRDALPRYIERLRDEGGRDIEKKQQRLSQHVVPFLGDYPLSGIASFDIERYKKHRLSELSPRSKVKPGHDERTNLTKPGTVNREIAALSHLLNKAVEWGWIDRRPARIRRLREDNARLIYLTQEQISRLLDVAKADQCLQIYPFTLIGLHTAMRRWEILSIRRDHVDLEARSIYIPEAKAGTRSQPITAELAQYLDRYIVDLPAGCPWLFPSPGAKGGHTVDISKAFRRVVTRAGLDARQVTPHVLRHTAITHLVQSGVDLPTVKRISGHKTLAMVERYAHANGVHIAAAMDKLDARYRSVS